MNHSKYRCCFVLKLGKAFGIDSDVLSPEETKKIYPLMRIDDIYGSVYSSSDGTIDPAGYVTALARAAKSSGAKVRSSRLCHYTCQGS